MALNINSPFDKKVAKALKAGDEVLINGLIVTARDAAHKYLIECDTPPFDLTGMIIYHCGPVIIKDGTEWKVTAAGPTTSVREEPYEAAIIRRFSPSAIMGKGGMGKVTHEALIESGSVYLSAAGGAAQYLASCIKEVKAVYLEDLGQPEAMWVLRVEKMPAVVSMDSAGMSLYSEILADSGGRLKNLLS